MTIFVPADVIPAARGGAYALTYSAGEELCVLSEGTLGRAREEGPHRAQFAKLARVFALLDVIGWETTIPHPAPTETVVDDEHACTLREAVADYLRTVEDAALCLDGEGHAERAATERGAAETLRAFLASLQDG